MERPISWNPADTFASSLDDDWAFDPDTGELYDTEGTWLGAMADPTLAAHVVAAHNGKPRR